MQAGCSGSLATWSTRSQTLATQPDPNWLAGTIDSSLPTAAAANLHTWQWQRMTSTQHYCCCCCRFASHCTPFATPKKPQPLAQSHSHTHPPLPAHLHTPQPPTPAPPTVKPHACIASRIFCSSTQQRALFRAYHLLDLQQLHAPVMRKQPQINRKAFTSSTSRRRHN